MRNLIGALVALLTSCGPAVPPLVGVFVGSTTTRLTCGVDAISYDEPATWVITETKAGTLLIDTNKTCSSLVSDLDGAIDPKSCPPFQDFGGLNTLNIKSGSMALDDGMLTFSLHGLNAYEGSTGFRCNGIYSVGGHLARVDAE